MGRGGRAGAMPCFCVRRRSFCSSITSSGGAGEENRHCRAWCQSVRSPLRRAAALCAAVPAPISEIDDVAKRSAAIAFPETNCAESVVSASATTLRTDAPARNRVNDCVRVRERVAAFAPRRTARSSRAAGTFASMRTERTPDTELDEPLRSRRTLPHGVGRRAAAMRSESGAESNPLPPLGPCAPKLLGNDTA